MFHKNLTTMKKALKDRLNAKSEKPANNAQKAVNDDPNSPASKQKCWALRCANAQARKFTGCELFGDWHEQGLTNAEADELIAEYNAINVAHGYVIKQKVAKKAVDNKGDKGTTTATNPRKNPKTPKQSVKQQANNALSELLKTEDGQAALLDAIEHIKQNGAIA